jgi:hypothetical protein
LVSQNIQTERTEIKAGNTPPKVTLTLPSSVKAGKPYELTAILTTPLDERPVLGGVTQFKAGTSGESPVLEGLEAGGLFKRNSVPVTKEDQLLSLGFIQSDGIYFITQRVKVD